MLHFIKSEATCWTTLLTNHMGMQSLWDQCEYNSWQICALNSHTRKVHEGKQHKCVMFYEYAMKYFQRFNTK